MCDVHVFMASVVCSICHQGMSKQAKHCRNGPHSRFEGNIILAQAVETFERSHPAVCIFIIDMVSSQAGYDT